jgi:hypothetical protein
MPEAERPSLPRFAGGSGTPEDPYRITSAEELRSVGHNPRLMECHFRLADDLDLSDVEFFPIGCPADIWWIEEGQDYPRLTWELESDGPGSDMNSEAPEPAGDAR